MPRLWSLLAGGLLLAAALTGCRPAALAPPNLLLVTLDTCRADALACYGGPVPTPTLDRLAAAGVRFLTCLAPTPLTLPSHAALMTGRLPSTLQVRDNGGYRLPGGVPVLAQELGAAGYATAAVVAGAPLGRASGLARGFDWYGDQLSAGEGGVLYARRAAPAVTDEAIAWLDGRLPAGSGAGAGPWFLWVHYYDLHAPYAPPEGDRDAHPHPYYATMASVDRALGRLLDRVEAAAGRARVVVTADHGEALGEHDEDAHGLFLYEAVMRVPLLMADLPPAEGATGRTVAGVARLTDLYATLLAWAGVPVPDRPHSVDLTPAWTGGRLPSDRFAYLETYHPWLAYGWAPLYGVRTDRWKLIVAPEPELYAPEEDPAESVNRHPAEPAVVEDLTAWLEAQVGAGGVWPPAPAPVDSQTRRQLASLGYAAGAGPAARTGLPDPKGRTALLREYQAAVLARARGREAAARRRGERLAAADPGNPSFLEFVGECWLDAGDPVRAEPWFHRVVAVAPGATSALANLGYCRKLQGDLPRAERWYRAALARDPHQAQVRSGLGEVLLQRGALTQGLQELTTAVSLAPHDGSIRANLGFACLMNGQPARAVAAFRQVLAADPSSAQAHEGLGVVALQSGDLDQAIAHFQSAVDLGTTNPIVAYHLAEAYRARGEPATARDWYRDFLDRAPPEMEAQRAAARAALRAL